MMNRVIYSVFAVLFTFACAEPEKPSQLPGISENMISEVKIIGHKGSGDYPYGFENFRANSKGSTYNPLQKIDGTEIDLQLSKSGTLWLFHDHEIKACEGQMINVATLDDEQIETISKCNYDNQLITFEKFVTDLEQESFKHKTISLDLKVLRNLATIESFKTIEELTKVVGEKIKLITKGSSINLLVEVPQKKLMEPMENISDAPTYWIISNGNDFKDADDDFNYSFSLDFLISKYGENYNDIVGESNQLWTANSYYFMQEALKFRADYIQTDNIPLAQFIKNSLQAKLKTDVIEKITNFGIKGTEEFMFIKTLDLDSYKNDFLLKVTVNNNQKLTEKLSVVFTARDTAQQRVYYESYSIQPDSATYIDFVGIDRMARLNCKQLKVYIHNPKQQELVFETVKLERLYY